MSDDAGQNDTAADDQLVLKAKVDAEAFAALYDLYYPRVLAYCIRRLGNREAAEDVTSEVFLSVAKHLAAFSGRCSTDFRRWLFRIATNATHAQLRQSLCAIRCSRQRCGEGRLRGSVSSPDLSDQRIEWNHVLAAIGSLGDREQTILGLRFFAGLSHDEIASVVDATPGAVRTALSRALKTLRSKLREGGLIESE